MSEVHNINVTPGNNPSINVTPVPNNSINVSVENTNVGINTTSTDVSVQESNNNIVVSNFGIQGPAGTGGGSQVSLTGFAGVSTINGLSGALTILGTGNLLVSIDGQSFILSGIESSESLQSSLLGLISTGDADLRYLSTGASGDLVGGTTDIEGLISTGDADLRYLASGASGDFLTVTNSGSLAERIEATGTYLIANGGSTDINGLISTGDADLRYLSTGASGDLVGGTTDIEGLISTGDADLRYLASGASGDFLTVTNSGSLAERIEATGTYLIANGGSTDINGLISTGDADLRYLASELYTGNALEFAYGNQTLPTGNIQNYFISFAENFDSIPNVVGNLVHSGGDSSVSAIIKEITISGFYVNSNDTLYENNYQYHFTATTGSGNYSFGATSLGGAALNTSGLSTSGNVENTGTQLISYFGGKSYNVLRSGENITGLDYENGDFTYIFYSGDLITGVFSNFKSNKKILYNNTEEITGVIYY